MPETPARSKNDIDLLYQVQKKQQWILYPQVQDYAVVLPIQYKDWNGWADCVNEFIQVVKQPYVMHIEPVRAIVGPADLAKVNAALDRINSVWRLYYHVDLDT
jgi:hypothetical protein